MTPYVSDPDFTLYLGDVREVLAGLPDGSVDCCVTSPPYLGLRDYGTDDQIGLEPTIGEYVDTMVGVFAQVRRVLADTGTCWLNLGDSYNAYNGGAGPGSKLSKTQTEARPRLSSGFGLQQKELKPKDLMGVPWRVALALQADGWYLRADIIWHKPNPMPESVSDRPTKSHEYVFLLTKSARYFYDADAISEPAAWERWGDQTVTKHEGTDTASGWLQPKTKREILAIADHRYEGLVSQRWGKRKDAGEPGRHGLNPESRGSDVGERGQKNARSVWAIPTQPYPGAHFAVFPEALPERCIKAGCPEGGTVLDPFMGSGTTALAARRLGRKSVGVELNPEYAALCARRLQQLSLLAEEPAA